jgi:uncharacterized integral membrane protein
MGQRLGTQAMKSIFKWLILTPIALIAVIFAIVNRQIVPVIIDPFGTDIPGLRFEAPLFFVMFACLILGALIGGLVTWIGQGKHRRSLREERAQSQRLRAENDRIRMAIGGDGSGETVSRSLGSPVA